MDHKKSEGERNIPDIHIDYCFMSGVKDDNTRTVVVAKDGETKMAMSSVAPVKGSGHEFPARWIRAFINELGCEHADVVVMSDREPANLDSASEIGRLRAPRER